jgi:hydrogenase-4 membrane subunit HyfE
MISSVGISVKAQMAKMVKVLSCQAVALRAAAKGAEERTEVEAVTVGVHTLAEKALLLAEKAETLAEIE